MGYEKVCEVLPSWANPSFFHAREKKSMCKCDYQNEISKGGSHAYCGCSGEGEEGIIKVESEVEYSGFHGDKVVAFSVHALTGEVLHSTIRLIGREEDDDSGGWW